VSAGRFPRIVAALTAIAAAIALGIGIVTPPRSGVFCTAGCLTYPYTAISPNFANDTMWIYPATVMVFGFVGLTACLVDRAPRSDRLAAIVALAFALMGAGLLVADYIVQLTVVGPSLADGEGADVAVLSMANPHGVFIGLENAGYFVLGLAFLGVAGAVGEGGAIDSSIRWVFLVAGVLAAGALPVLAALFGTDLDVRYEVAAITVDYFALVLGGALFTVRFGPKVATAPILAEGAPR
jgi:hypothetical protein